MYHHHFGLRQSPFGMTPNPAFFYAGNTRGDILAALLYAVEHGEGIVKVTGEVGSGKTMLCRMLEHHLPAHIDVIYLANPTLKHSDVAYAIAGELELDVGGKRIDEVTRMLQADLIARHSAGRQVLLLVEEAQAMPLDTLEEVRLFSNLETARHKLLQIVLFGQPELDAHLDLASMRQFKERITHSFVVPAMPPDAIPDFLAFRLHAAGYNGPAVFSGSAIRQIARVSQGIVRRINILADKALMAAYIDESDRVEARHARAAVADCAFARQPGLRLPWLAAAALGLAALAWLAWQLA
jgi:MSHA biogenesis protein MshM